MYIPDNVVGTKVAPSPVSLTKKTRAVASFEPGAAKMQKQRPQTQHTTKRGKRREQAAGKNQRPRLLVTVQAVVAERPHCVRTSWLTVASAVQPSPRATTTTTTANNNLTKLQAQENEKNGRQNANIKKNSTLTIPPDPSPKNAHTKTNTDHEPAQP